MSTSAPSGVAQPAQNPAPVAGGTLEQRPLPRLLQQVFRKHVTGRFVVTDEGGEESQVYVRDGAPVHVVRPNDIDRLDQVLTESGVLSAALIAQVSSEVGPGRRLGELLLAKGYLDPKTLGGVLKLQIRRKLLRLFFPRRGRWAIYLEPHGFGNGPEFAEMRVDTRCLLYPGIRAAYDESRLAAEIEPLAGFSFRLLPTIPASLLEAMGFPPADPTLQALGERFLTLADLPPAPASRVEALRVVLSLLYTDLLEAQPLAQSAAAPAVRAQPSRRPTLSGSSFSGPSPPASGDPALRAQIEDLSAKLDSTNHFELLGVAETASAQELGTAYLGQMRRFHPDRLAGMGLGDLTAKASRIVARVNEANAVLADPKRRADYLAARAGNPVEVDAAQMILGAEESFSQGDLFLKRGDFAKAAEAFAAAMQANSLEPAYKAYWAWARWAQPSAPKDRMVRETLKVLMDALAERPMFPQAHHWCGLLYKHLGQNERAEEAFRQAIAQDGSLIEAQRELRVLEMRRARITASHPAVSDRPATASAARSKDGLFGRLLKKGS